MLNDRRGSSIHDLPIHQNVAGAYSVLLRSPMTSSVVNATEVLNDQMPYSTTPSIALRNDDFSDPSCIKPI
jgi:hypothetical protein